MSGVQRDGTPKRDPMMQAVEIDILACLRCRGGSRREMRERLTARAYLLEKGWTVAEINEAAAKEE